MSQNFFKVVVYFVVLIGYVQPSFAFADKNNAIILGVSNAQTGPAKQLGIRLNQGAKVYFNKVNLNGGINGRPVHLIIRDDGYEPFKTVVNVQQLLNEYELFGFFNLVGTPTTNAALPMIKASNLPLLMPFTGAEFLRTADKQQVFNLRASYYQESRAQIDYLTKQKGFKKFGLLIQADEFGLAVEQGYLNTMKEYGLSPTIVTRYRRNTDDINLALELLKKHQVEVVLFVGTYEPMATLINRASKLNFNPFYSTVSFISSHDLFTRIHSSLKVEVLVTEVMPDPNHCTNPLCLQFIHDMKKAGYTHYDQIQLEGYLNALMFSESAKACSQTLTSQCLLKQLNKAPVNLFDESFLSDSQGKHSPPVYLNFF